MGAHLQLLEKSPQGTRGQYKSQIASLDKLEQHLSHAPGYLRRNSRVEAFFNEINYSSFRTEHQLTTSLKPQKNGTSAKLVATLKPCNA